MSEAVTSSVSAQTPTERVLNARVAALERRMRVMMAGGVLLASGALMASRRPADTLRVTGLVVVDAQGRERIVLGAPLDAASSDAKLSGAAGIAILDSLGRLAVAVGQDNPLIGNDGKAARRMGSTNGLNIYDPRNGSERGGISVFGSGTVNMCLDYSTGKEAACASVAKDDSYSVMQLYGTPNEKQYDRVGMFLGSDGSGQLKVLGGGTKFTDGIIIDAGEGAPSVKLVDKSGRLISHFVKELK